MTDRDTLAAALAALVPAPAAINRDRLCFEAGLAAGQRTARRWKVTASLGLTACIALLGTLVVRSNADPVTPFVAIEQTTPPTEPASVASPGSVLADEDAIRWLKLRNQVVARGVDELPPAPPGDAPGGFDPRSRVFNLD